MTIASVQENPIAVRLPPELREYVKTQARKSFRSLSSEIAARVEWSRKNDEVQTQGATQ